MVLLLAVLGSALPLLAGAAPELPRDPFPGGMAASEVEDLPRFTQDLKDGDWNARIHAVHGLGAMGPKALAALRLSLQDADWQVRFTAVHMLGRMGLPGAPALKAALKDDPCRVVRITAVDWLGDMKALDALGAAADDESGLVRLTRWYWLRKQGAIDARAPHPIESPNEELNICLSSPFPISNDVRRQLELAKLRGGDGPIVVTRAPGPVEQVVRDTQRFDGDVIVNVLKREPPTSSADEEPLEDGDEEFETTGVSKTPTRAETLPRPAGIPARPKEARAAEPEAQDIARYLELDSLMPEIDLEPETLPEPTSPPPPAAREEDLQTEIPDREGGEPLLLVETRLPAETETLPGPRVPLPKPEPRVSAEAAMEQPDSVRNNYALKPILVAEGEHLPRPEGPTPRPQPPVSAQARLEHPEPRAEEGSPLQALLIGEQETLGRPEGPSPRREERASAAAGLMDDHGAGTPEHNALPDLLVALSGGSLPLRCRAAEELGKLGPAAGTAVPELMLALQDKSPRLRSSAAIALGNIGPASDPAIRPLVRALSDKSADVRYSAAHALARIGTPASKKAFRRYVKSEAKRSIRSR